MMLAAFILAAFLTIVEDPVHPSCTVTTLALALLSVSLLLHEVDCINEAKVKQVPERLDAA